VRTALPCGSEFSTIGRELHFHNSRSTYLFQPFSVVALRLLNRESDPRTLRVEGLNGR
jgi:hypothetical protein